MSHTRNALVDAIASLQTSDGGIIAASEVHELLTKIQDILENVVSKGVNNTACILAYVFNICFQAASWHWSFTVSLFSQY